jgi:hypothetical protein
MEANDQNLATAIDDLQQAPQQQVVAPARLLIGSILGKPFPSFQAEFTA